MGKFTKAEVDFEHPASGMDLCRRCVYFQPATKSCRIVEGLIQPNDWCNKFQEKKMVEGKRHKFTHTHIELHDDGSATIHHVHADGPHKDIKYAAGDLDEVHDGIQKNLNPEEEERLEEKIHPGLHQEALKKTGREEELEEEAHPGIHGEVEKMAGKEK